MSESSLACRAEARPKGERRLRLGGVRLRDRATAFACQKARWLAESKLAAGERRLVAQIFTRWNRIVDWLWQIAGKPHKQSSQQLTVLWVFSQTASGKAIVRRRP
jgi:hypothetical protein